MAKALAAGTDRRLVLRGLAGGALAGLFALVGGVSPTNANDDDDDRGGGDKPRTFTICHQPGTSAQKTMTVPESAVLGHLRHGDRIGARPTGPAGPTGPTGTTGGSGTTSASSTTPAPSSTRSPAGSTPTTSATPTAAPRPATSRSMATRLPRS